MEGRNKELLANICIKTCLYGDVIFLNQKEKGDGFTFGTGNRSNMFFCM